MKIIASIEDPPVIAKILTHLYLPARAPRSPAGRLDLVHAAGVSDADSLAALIPALGLLLPVQTKRREITPSSSCGRGNFQQRLGCLTA